MPAEWERQEAVWFAWPTREDLWPGHIEAVRDGLASLYALAARHETVRVLCPADAAASLQRRLEAQGAGASIERFDYRTDDVWVRDFGPLFLKQAGRGRVAVTDWVYNAWGGKFPRQARDNAAPEWIAERLGLERFAFDTVLEGGAIESNGAGCLLTTEAVLLNPNRNGGLGRAEVERRLVEGLGIDRILWLETGLHGDDTDGHIDNVARFFAPDGILHAVASGPEDPNGPCLAENLGRLKGFRTAGTAPFRCVALPLPAPMEGPDGPLAASYLNFLVLNGAVIVPTFGQPENDARALEVIGSCFPGREVRGYDCRTFVLEGGGIHCMSQHQPAAG